jgi:outer membrane protein OmpA-like peptidoglycan-associated protein
LCSYPGGLVLNNLLFESGKAQVRPEALAEIQKVVAEMQKYPNDTVIVEGHANDGGSSAYNMALGHQRADAVRDVMVQMGVAPMAAACKPCARIKM